mmetsp:Transcript_23147/g.59489  ORF Transcript_23147/g.59489 Transcript_23147/m.59489 type:complete len:370 (+) Transcript_23147:441-1550(+)
MRVLFASSSARLGFARARLRVLEDLIERVHVQVVDIEFDLLVAVLLQGVRALLVDHLHDCVQLSQAQFGARVVEFLLLLEGRPSIPIGYGLTCALRVHLAVEVERTLAVEDSIDQRCNNPKHGTRAVVFDAVFEGEFDVLGELLDVCVLIRLKLPLHSSQVHRRAHLLVVVMQPQALNVDRVQEPLRHRMIHDLGEDKLAPDRHLKRGERVEPFRLQFAQLFLRVLAQLFGVFKVDRLGRVEDERILPDQADVVSELLQCGVLSLLEVALDGAQVHRVLDHLRVLGQIQRLPVDRREEDLRLRSLRDGLQKVEGLLVHGLVEHDTRDARKHLLSLVAVLRHLRHLNPHRAGMAAVAVSLCDSKRGESPL